jgi:hypothetical protein
MPGVRIHHREKRSCMWEIPHMGRPTATGPKLYRLTLDDQGDTIVSAVVWERIREALALLDAPSPFLVMNEVAHPPTQLIRIGERSHVARRSPCRV